MTRKILCFLITVFAVTLLAAAPSYSQDKGEASPTPAEESATAEDSATEDVVKNTADSSEEEQPKEDSGKESAAEDNAGEKPDEKAEKKSDDSEKKEAGEKKAEKKDKKEKPKRKTLKLKAKPLKVEVTVSGDLVSREMTRVELAPESWSKWKIEEVVPHGARVRVGETLVRFDAEELNEALADMELDQRLGELALIKAEREMPLLEESLERQLKNAQRSWDEAQVDYARYTEKERDLVVKQYAMRLKQSKFNLEYARDELDQLEKMYEADDLTEETEELILNRQRTQFEFAQFSYEIAKYSNGVSMDVFLPRSDEREKEAQRAIELSLERAKIASELDLTRARYTLEKARKDRQEAIEKHSDLIADKGLMNLKSPAAGVVYYGKCANGKWGEVVSLKQKLLPEKSVPKGTVMMTIIDSAELYLFGALSEKDLPSVKEGQPVKIDLAAEGVEPIKATVSSVAGVPTARGKFEIEIDITGDKPEWLVPGMTGKAKVLTYEKKEALLVPKNAVHEDEATDRKYVWQVETEGDKVEVEKQWVKTGKSKDKEIEITSGLDAGDVISLDPKEKGTDEEDDHEDD